MVTTKICKTGSGSIDRKSKFQEEDKMKESGFFRENINYGIARSYHGVNFGSLKKACRKNKMPGQNQKKEATLGKTLKFIYFYIIISQHRCMY